VTQAQFAGYYVAAAKGYYKDVGLDVTINSGGPDTAPAPDVESPARVVRIPFAELLEHPARARLDGRLLDLPPIDRPPGDARPCFATRDQQAIAV
jgi:hypothetical protein